MSKRLLTVGVTLCLAVPALAQDYPPGETFVGYSFLRDIDGEENANLGWNVSIARNFSSTLGFVIDTSGHYPEGVTQHNFTIGPRLSSRSGSFVPFAQVTAGFSRVSSDFGSNTGFLVMPGAGIDLDSGGRRTIRLSADFLLVSDEGDTFKQFRASVGILFRASRR